MIEENLIPTEEDSIREITVKYNSLLKDHTIIVDKNRELQRQTEYLQQDLKQKLPLLSLRKNEYKTMCKNYQILKDKLHVSV